MLFPSGKKIDVEANGFLIKTDQCVAAEGGASAPESFDYF